MSEKEKTMDEEKAIDIKELLLCAPKEPVPTSKVNIKRLSKAAKKQDCFDIRALTYDEIAFIQRTYDDVDVKIVLKGVTSPNLASPEFMEGVGAPTPAIAVKRFFLAGEIAEISHAIQRLSGYMRITIEEVKKK